MSLKLKKILLSFVLIVLISSIMVVGIYYLLNWEDIEYKNSMKRNKEHFLMLVEEFESMYDKEMDGTLSIWFKVEAGEYMLDLWSNRRNETISVGTSTRFEIDALRGAFGQDDWSKAIVTEQGVSFSSEGNHYAFVYTFDGKKPKYMNSSEERFSIKSQPIGEKCYFVKSYN